MNQFEFISVFISIIFGLGLTHVLTGAMQRLYHGGIGYIHLAYTVVTLTLLILNWWVLFLWRDHAIWTFATFLVLIGDPNKIDVGTKYGNYGASVVNMMSCFDGR